MKKLFLSFLFATISILGFSQTTWNVDPMHSSFNFNIKHLGISFVQGRFDKFEGKVVTTADDLSNAKFDFTVNTASVNTGVEMRDNHLKSADFFDVDNFPKLSFVSTDVKKINEGEYKISGDLTIKDVTKSIVLDVEYSGLMTDPWGNTKIGLSLNGKINRKEFGLTWNSTLEAGGVLVGEEIKLVSEIQFIKQ